MCASTRCTEVACNSQIVDKTFFTKRRNHLCPQPSPVSNRGSMQLGCFCLLSPLKESTLCLSMQFGCFSFSPFKESTLRNPRATPTHPTTSPSCSKPSTLWIKRCAKHVCKIDSQKYEELVSRAVCTEKRCNNLEHILKAVQRNPRATSTHPTTSLSCSKRCISEQLRASEAMIVTSLLRRGGSCSTTIAVALASALVARLHYFGSASCYVLPRYERHYNDAEASLKTFQDHLKHIDEITRNGGNEPSKEKQASMIAPSLASSVAAVSTRLLHSTVPNLSTFHKSFSKSFSNRSFSNRSSSWLHRRASEQRRGHTNAGTLQLERHRAWRHHQAMQAMQ